MTSVRRETQNDVKGTVKVGVRTKDLVKRLHSGDIAIIDHVDLDRVAAESLVASGVAAIVNASASISGRYPNSGPLIVVKAGIPIVDRVGSGVIDDVVDGETLTVVGGEVRRGDTVVARGTLLDVESVSAVMEEARVSIGDELRRFASNTLEYVEREADLTFLPLELPSLRAEFRGRHALVVVRGHDYQADLAALRAYIREFRPVLIGVDGGTDALLDQGFVPDVIIGDFDSVSPRRAGHHCGPRSPRTSRRSSARARQPPGLGDALPGIRGRGNERGRRDALAYEAGSTLIVAVGTHATMVEFLDKGRAGMASTFLTRLRLGPILVDAKGVNRLYEQRVRRRDLALLVASALVVVLVMVMVSEPLHVFLDGLRFTMNQWWSSVRDAL